MSSSPPPEAQPEDDSEWPSVPELHISTRGKILRVLTFTQHASGVLFSTFLLVHLIPPAIVAVTGDESSGSAFMLLGKVYYQGNLSEPLLIYGSLGVHAITSAARRIFYPRSLPSITKSAHSLTGYLAIPFVALHLQLHRWIPSIKAPPISSLSPSEIDLNFVGFNLQRFPFLSSLYYISITGLVLYHGLSGLAIAGRRWGLLSTDSSKNARARRQAGLLGGTVATVGLVSLGLLRLGRDSYTPSGLAQRFMEVHRLALPKSLV